jgi:hypothetical protein
MRAIAVFVALVGILALPTTASADKGGKFGLGLAVGDPGSGISAQYKLGGPGKGTALNFMLGLELIDDEDIYFHLDYIVKIAELHRGSSVTIPAYVGIGGYFADRGNDSFGVRAPFGLQFDFNTAPIHIFAELALFLRLVDDVDLDVGGLIGFRYFF